ncbi:MAG: hypothetical protein ACI4V7_08205 [Succinivibrionaceae bacterium]
MATKVSSYLTKLGFKQLEHVADAANYNNETGGEYIVIRENTRIYLYDATSNAPIDSISILPTSDGGASRWIAVGGGAMTQYKISYTFESYSNEIPLGMTILSKANIFYVNIENTQILSTEFNLNDAKDTIVLSKPFEAGVRTEVVIFVGDYQPESRDYELLTNKPMVNGITLVGNRSLGELGIQPAGDYATNTRVNTVENTLENKKADKATTLAGYNIGDAYTKTEVDSIKTDLTTEINKKANSDNVYTKSEIDTTVADLNQKITDKDSLPEQAGNTDKFLTTNGTEASWATIDKTTVGLNNVDNTSDLDKPISTAVQGVLDGKADKATTLSGYGITDAYTKEEIENTYAKSVDIPTKVSQLENDSGYLTEHQDISGKADTSYVNEELAKKQDVISDLETIREGASKGATALQTETDPIYTADKPNIALKSEIPTNVSSLTNDAGYQTASDVASAIASIPQFEMKIVDVLPATGQKMVLYLLPKISVSGDNIYDEYIWLESTSSFELVGSTTVDLSDYYTKTETNEKLATKQDTLTAGNGIKIENNTITNTYEVPENVVTSDNYVNSKLWKGTLAEYNALTTYDDAVTYFITDDNAQTQNTTLANKINALEARIAALEAQLNS